MPTLASKRHEALIARTLGFFENLTRTEQLAIQSCAYGEDRECAIDGEPLELDSWETWPNDRKCRAELLAFLLTDEECKKNSDPRGPYLTHALIDGELDLESQALAVPFWLNESVLRGGFELRDAVVPAIGIFDSRVVGSLSAGRLRTVQSLLINNTEVHGSVRIAGAIIGQQFSLSGSEIYGVEGESIDANHCEINGSLIFRDLLTR